MERALLISVIAMMIWSGCQTGTGTDWVLQGSLAEDTFVEGSPLDAASHEPTGDKRSRVGFGGWTYNENGSAASTDDVQVDTSYVRNAVSGSGPWRGRSIYDVDDDNIRVYATLGRDVNDGIDTKAGVRVLVDGSEAVATEKDGVEISFERQFALEAALVVREWVDGVQESFKFFYATAGGGYFTWGSGAQYGVVVEIEGDDLTITVCDVFTDGYYYIENPVTIYSGGVADSVFTLSQSRVGKKRLGWLVAGTGTTAGGRVYNMFVEGL